MNCSQYVDMVVDYNCAKPTRPVSDGHQTVVISEGRRARESPPNNARINDDKTFRQDADMGLVSGRQFYSPIIPDACF